MIIYPPPIIEEITEKSQSYKIDHDTEIHHLFIELSQSFSDAALHHSLDTSKTILTTIIGNNHDGFFLSHSLNSIHFNPQHSYFFVSSHHHAKVQFPLSGCQISFVTFKGAPAIFVEYPESLHRFQRRDFFRVTPSDHPKILLPHHDGKNTTISSGNILDISGGGIGLECSSESVMEVGILYQNCTIKTPDVGEIICSIQVKNHVHLMRNDQPIIRTGCAFYQLGSETSIKLQRYINSIQSSQLRKNHLL